jgi:biotin carboxylase
MTNPTKRFTSKKLLLLGTNVGTCDMVNYARSQGAYVIVADNLPPEKSTAKLIADETWSVSTADVDIIEQLAIKNQINGIFAGVSDFNLEKALTLCDRLGLPFYCNRQQWETCLNKQSFKQLCLANDVPVAREYRIDENCKSEDLRQIQYPVIVKPVDMSAGIGIRVCRNEDELLESYSKAVSVSSAKQAIVEEFVEGDELNVAYTIKNGQFSLSHLADRYVNPEPGKTIPLLQATIYPSKYTDRYIEELNAKVIKMFKSIGLANGFIFIQGRLNNKGFHFFEANYRIGSTGEYRFTSRINHINYMEMLVNYALTAEMDVYDLSLDNPKFNRWACGLPLVSKGGVVGKITGIEEIRRKKSLIAVDMQYGIGDYIEKSGTLRQILFKFLLIEDTLQELKNSIKEIQNTVKVLDDQGKDMLLFSFNTDRI